MAEYQIPDVAPVLMALVGLPPYQQRFKTGDNNVLFKRWSATDDQPVHIVIEVITPGVGLDTYWYYGLWEDRETVSVDDYRPLEVSRM